MPTNEYMTPEIGNVIDMLNQSCNDLTRQALIHALTKKTQEWVQGDPELADILVEGKKTLEGCIRYVTEKAATIIAKNVNSMLNAEFEKLPRMKIQDREVTGAGGAIEDEQVYKWAQEYYYDPKAEPRDFKREAEEKAEAAKRAAENAKLNAEKQAAKKTTKGKNKTKTATAAQTASTNDTDKDGNGEEKPPATVPTGISKDIKPIVGGAQTSLFGDQPEADAA